MGKSQKSFSLASALFGNTRRAILALFFGRPDESFYFSEVVRAAGGGHGTVQRELDQLSQARILRRVVRGREVHYQADPQCPIFEELKSLVVKTSGVADVLRAALTPLAERIQAAFIFGSVAQGRQKAESDVDLLVVGEVTFGDVVSALAPAQKTLAREINPTVYPRTEFRQKLAAGNHFLKTLMQSPRIFLIGDERELEGLGKGRLAR